MKKFKLSLAMTMALIMAFVTAIGMGLYAIFQFFTMPNSSLSNLILHHGWHVLALGTFSYLVLYFVLYKLVVKPILKVYVKCYAITKGDLSKLELESNIKEIQMIIDGVNLTSQQIQQMVSSEDEEVFN